MIILCPWNNIFQKKKMNVHNNMKKWKIVRVLLLETNVPHNNERLHN